MANQNGQLILKALQNLEEPATVKKIVTHIADTAGVRPNDVKQSVQDTLNVGVRYGYIQRSKRKYYAAPVDLDNIAGEEGGGPEPDANKDDSKESGELEDRGGKRRKRRGGRSRSRSRRVSRRRRRR